MRSPLLMLIPAVLLAQRPALPPQQALDREFMRNRLGTWLVLDDEGAAWGATLRAALDDDALISLNLPMWAVSGGKKPDAVAATVRDRYGWAKGAHWGLVDVKGRLLVEGAAQPTIPSLVAAVEQSGVKSRTQELETFLRQNPDHLEAQGALLEELVQVANRRTHTILGDPPEKPANGQPEAPAPPQLLDAESDLKIWSPVVRQLERLLQGAWREVGVEPGVVISMASAEHSPSMIALLTHYKTDMEDALKRRPNSMEPWMVWLAASRKCGGWPLAPLLQTLQPLPEAAAEWPPRMVLNEFIKDAKSRRAWGSIREVLEPRWEAMRANVPRWAEGAAMWSLILSPLVEALVSQGDVGAADQVLGEAAGISRWSGLAGSARDLATRLNRPDLAARWGTLTTKDR